MGFLEDLGIDKCYSISTSKKERFINMMQIKKDLDMHIEIIDPIRDTKPRISHSKTIIKILKESRGRYKKILIFEDDAWTDLSLREVREIIAKSQIDKIEYDILSLGSQSYIRNEFNEYLYRAEAFGYAHALIYNIETITDAFIQNLEDECVNKGINVDCAISRSLHLLKNVFVIKDSIFLQLFPSTIDNSTKNLEEFNHLYNLDFRHTRNQEIKDEFVCTKTVKSKRDNQGNYLKFFGNFDVDFIFFHFRKKIGTSDKRYSVLVSSYDSGANLNSIQDLPHNFYFSMSCAFGDIFIEIFEGERIVHREIFNISLVREGIVEYELN
jgi:hypothetical protein